MRLGKMLVLLGLVPGPLLIAIDMVCTYHGAPMNAALYGYAMPLTMVGIPVAILGAVLWLSEMKE